MFKNFKSERERNQQEKLLDGRVEVPVLNFLRCFACIAIIVHHFLLCGYFNTFGIKNHFLYSGLIMSVFFWCTGFLITLSLEHCSVKAFLIKRFFRLMPVLLFMLILYFLFITRFAHCSNWYKFKMFITNLTLTNDVISAKKIIGVSWSMNVDIKFYLLSALCFFLFKTPRKRLYFGYILTIGIILLLKILHFNSGWQSLLFCCILVLSCYSGCIYYYFLTKKISKKEFVILYAINVLFMFIFLSNFSFSMNIVKFFKHLNYLGWPITYPLGAILIGWFVNKYKDFGNWKISKTLADLSYSLYLFHPLQQNLTFKIYKNTKKTLGAFIENSLYLTIMFSMTWLVCCFVYKYIEKPCYDFGKKLAKKIDNKAKL